MKKRERMRYALLIFLLLLLLTGCGKEAEDSIQNRVVVDKNGAMTVTNIASFTEEYLDAKEMREMIEEEIAVFSDAEKAPVEIKKCSAARDRAELVIWYESHEDYQRFNEMNAYYGSLEDALAQGIIASDQLLLNAAGNLETTAGELENGAEYGLFLFTEESEVLIKPEILYYGGTAALDENGAFVREKGDAYFIYALGGGK